MNLIRSTTSELKQADQGEFHIQREKRIYGDSAICVLVRFNEDGTVHNNQPKSKTKFSMFYADIAKLISPVFKKYGAGELTESVFKLYFMNQSKSPKHATSDPTPFL